MNSRIGRNRSNLEQLESWELDALGWFQTWFPNLEIRQPHFSEAEAEPHWMMAFFACYVADQLAEKYGTGGKIAFSEAEDGRLDINYAHACPRAREALGLFIQDFLKKPTETHDRILEGGYHASGNVPDIEQRIRIMDQVVNGFPPPRPGTAGSGKYLVDLMRRVKTGRSSNRDMKRFESHYGHLADAAQKTPRRPGKANQIRVHIS